MIHAVARPSLRKAASQVLQATALEKYCASAIPQTCDAEPICEPDTTFPLWNGHVQLQVCFGLAISPHV